MKRHAWLIVPALIVLYCCNAEKRVLNDTDKTQHVVNAWMKKQNFKTDTVLRYLPGDTTTTLLISYDTTTVRDTVTNIVEKQVTKTKVITNTVHDTVRVEIKNNDLLNACQDALKNNGIVLEEHRLGEKAEMIRAGLWKLRFWVAISTFALLVALVVAIKLFKPRIPFT
jgi:hypothetical protein